MNLRVVALFPAALGVLVGCEQASQSLPFAAPAAEVVRTVPSTGALISSVTGASVHFPAGAVPAGTRVSLATVVAPEQSVSGTAAGAHAYRLEPAGTALMRPAGVDLKIDATRRDAWLAAIVVSTPAGAVEDGDARVDLTSGVLQGKISALGTVSAVIPEAAAVVTARGLSEVAEAGAGAAPAAHVAHSAAPASPTLGLRGGCGEIRNRCSRLAIGVSENLLRTADTVAAVFPRIGGEIRIQGARASGRLTLVAPLRIRLSRGSALTLHSEITAEPTAATTVSETAGVLTLSHMRISGRAGSEEEEAVTTLTVRYQGSQASIVLDQAFLTSIRPGQLQQARIAARIPLTRVH